VNGVEIKKVSIIGLGALGVMFGKRLIEGMSRDDLVFVADAQRVQRYRRDGVYANGERMGFSYACAEEKPSAPDDLVMFATKCGGLDDAVEAAKNRVGKDTILLSMLNGITSERIIAKAYGWENVICCVAQGTDAVKVGNRLTFSNYGILAIGGCEKGLAPEKARRVARFFERTGFPFLLDENMPKRMWGKWMLNVGLNQTLAVYGGGYRAVQIPGQARTLMIAAFHEVIALAKAEGIELSEADVPYWLAILDALNPEGKPSMQQDVEAGRKTEVEMFAGAVIELGRQYKVSTPVNEELYARIKAIEAGF
jgi:2-dehydropantoate 2-reductase